VQSSSPQSSYIPEGLSPKFLVPDSLTRASTNACSSERDLSSDLPVSEALPFDRLISAARSSRDCKICFTALLIGWIALRT